MTLKDLAVRPIRPFFLRTISRAISLLIMDHRQRDILILTTLGSFLTPFHGLLHPYRPDPLRPDSRYLAEEDWFDYRLENDPRFLKRIESARASLQAGKGIRMEDL